MNNAPIRILIVDDHPGVRKSTRIFLETNAHFEVVDDCDNGHCAVEKAEHLIPDIMLVDINMEPMNGFEVVEKVLLKVPSIKIIAFSINNQPKYVRQMLGLGARGYLTKTSSPREIAQGIMEVHRGDIYICQEVVRNMPPSE